MSSPTKPTTCIEDLPPEMICELFEYLHPKDLASCSMVNKRWHSIYAGFKVHRLAAFDYHPICAFIKWLGANRPIQEAELYSPAMFVRLAEKPLLSNLKHLGLFGELEFDLNKLNRYRQLVHLEIDSLAGQQVQLNLPKLKVLAFHRWNYGCALSIDCPELSTLAYYAAVECGNQLDVKDPETIRRLETRIFDQKWLAPFKSVECLVIYQFAAISKATLLLLPRLKELRYDGDIEGIVPNEIRTIDRMKQTLIEFLGEAKKLKGKDFRFTFAGFQLTNVNVNVDQIDFGVQVDEGSNTESVFSEYIYMKNYHLIEPNALDFVDFIYYTDLLSHTTGEFPRCFSQKFTGILEVRVDDVVKAPDHLLWFLKSLKFLRRLHLVKPKLSQEFYDQLPAAAHSLAHLYLDEDRETELQLNFDFIAQFPHLECLAIHQPLSVRSTASLVRWLGRLKDASICVRSEKDNWIVKHRDSALWKIQEVSGYTQECLFKTENPGELGIFFGVPGF